MRAEGAVAEAGDEDDVEEDEDEDEDEDEVVDEAVEDSVSSSLRFSAARPQPGSVKGAAPVEEFAAAAALSAASRCATSAARSRYTLLKIPMLSMTVGRRQEKTPEHDSAKVTRSSSMSCQICHAPERKEKLSKNQ